MAQATSSKTAADAAQAGADTENAVNKAAEAARPAPLTIGRPIVYEVKKKGRRGKKKYSRGLREPQRLERGAARSAERLAQALADGMSKYRKRRNDSARKKRDGAIKDFSRNLGRGAETAIRRSAKAPSDFTRKLSLRRLTKFALPPLPRFVR